MQPKASLTFFVQTMTFFLFSSDRALNDKMLSVVLLVTKKKSSSDYGYNNRLMITRVHV